jgi:hypothetical protein
VTNFHSPLGECRECARTRQEFAEATNDHLRILGEQQTAVIRKDPDALAKLNQAIAECEARRKIARDAFKNHAASHGAST